MRKLPLLSLPFVVALLIGCGGGGANSLGSRGGGGSQSTQTTPVVLVDWPARTRNLTGPNSALSVSITLRELSPQGAQVVIKGDRAPSLSPFTQAFSASTTAQPGSYLLSARFYSGPGETGSVTATTGVDVGIASNGVISNTDGTALGPVAFSGKIQQVLIPAGQMFLVGAPKQVLVSAVSTSGSVLALSPGSYDFTVSRGTGDAVITPDGILSGISAGTVQITATVDGVFSSPTPGTVLGQLEFADPGFETPVYAPGTWVSDQQTQGPWSGHFTLGHDTWGIADGAGSWGNTAHSGNQYAFFQRGASIYQTIQGTVPGVTYQVSFWAAGRDGNVGGNTPDPMHVLADGNTILPEFTPPGTPWEQYTTQTFVATSTSVTITFQGRDTGYDESDLLDDLHLITVVQ